MNIGSRFLQVIEDYTGDSFFLRHRVGSVNTTADVGDDVRCLSGH